MPRQAPATATDISLRSRRSDNGSYELVPLTNATDLDALESGQSTKQLHKPLGKVTFFSLISVFVFSGDVCGSFRSALIWVCVLGSKGASVSSPLFLAQAANELVANRYSSAMLNITFFCVMKYAASALSEIRSMLYYKIREKAITQLQVQTFDHLHRLSLDWHLSKKTGSIIKSMDRGIDSVNSIITQLVLFLFPTILESLAVVSLFFVEFSQWLLGVFVIVGVILYSAASIFLVNYRKKFREQTNKFDNDYHDKASESLLNYETIKYFTNEAYESGLFENSVERYQVTQTKTQYLVNILNLSQQLILILTMAGCMIVSGQAVIRGEMSIGSWIAVQAWVANVFAPLNWLGSLYSSIFQSFIDVQNLVELLNQEPQIVDAVDAVEFQIDKARSSGLSVEFRNVSFHYPSQPPEEGLKDVSITIAAGSTTAIVGATGSGKTTLSRLLFRFFDPMSGSVLINGQSLKDIAQESLRKAIGIVPQDTVLFNESIWKNIQYGDLSASKEAVIQAAERAQIKQFIEESLPKSWDTVVGERGLKLSGGQKQRVAIARCLLKAPPLVVLDEVKYSMFFVFFSY